MAQPYRFVNGQMMPTSWSWGGQEIPDMFTQQAVQQQREATTLTGGQLAEINKTAAPIVSEFKEMYSGILKEGMASTARFGAPAPTTLMQIEKFREFGAKFGVMPTPEQQTQEMQLMFANLKSRTSEMKGTSYEKTLAGIGDIPMILDQMVAGQKVELPGGTTEELGTMSGIGSAVNSLIDAFKSFNTVMPPAISQIGDLNKSISELGATAGSTAANISAKGGGETGGETQINTSGLNDEQSRALAKKLGMTAAAENVGIYTDAGGGIGAGTQSLERTGAEKFIDSIANFLGGSLLSPNAASAGIAEEIALEEKLKTEYPQSEDANKWFGGKSEQEWVSAKMKNILAGKDPE